jgi:hypothetical protein
VFSLVVKFPSMAKKKKVLSEEYKGFLKKKIGQTHHILREKNLKFP